MSHNVNAREARATAMCRTLAWAKKATVSNVTYNLVTTKLSILNETWKTYNELHDAVLGVCGSETLDEQNKTYPPNEEIYIDAKTRLMTLLDLFKPPTPTGPPAPRPNVVTHPSTSSLLPKINIPTFTGGYVEWQSFVDLYSVLIHNNASLSAIEKFHHLRSALAGEAANIVAHITITNDNYEVAWKVLKTRYTNTRIIVSQLLARLMTQQCQSESVDNIKNLLDTTKQCLEMLANLNRPTNQWDDIVVHLIVEKLPKHSRQLWETSLADSTTPATWQQLETFLRTRFRTLEASSGLSSTTGSTGASSKLVSSKQFVINNITKLTCSFCGEPHPIARCEKYLGASVAVRRQHVRDSHLCFNCLYPHHSSRECTSSHRCKHCGQAHHSTIHQTSFINNNNDNRASTNFSSTNTKQQSFIEFVPQSSGTLIPTTSTTSSSTVLTPTASSNVAISSGISRIISANNVTTTSTSGGVQNNLTINPLEQFKHSTVLLATAQVKATTILGSTIVLRALIDAGSQISLITERAAQMLGLKRHRSTVDIVPVGQHSTISSNGITTVHLSSCNNNNSVQTNVHILPKITSVLPTSRINVACRLNVPEPTADPQWNQPLPIDILLGADIYHNIIINGIKKLNNGSLLAQNTIFGWILTGQIFEETKDQKICSHIVTADQVDRLLSRFWEILDNTIDEPSIKAEESFIEQHFASTHQRLPNGKYQVRLPFKSLLTGVPMTLNNSLSSSISRLHQIERRNQRDETLSTEYVKFMNDYENSQHMERIPVNKIHHRMNSCCYLPHHAVFKPSSTTTKVRIVFDGSHKAPNCSSLNETLIIGPTLQAALVDTVHHWRNFRYTLCADVKQMYRQILIHPEDREYQRIVWRRTSSEPIQHYRLNTVTYGTSAAPYLAVRTLRQLAIDEADNYPLASKAALSHFYVDDLLSGAHDIPTAIRLYVELQSMLNSGGMKLLKWASNSDEILSTIDEKERQCQIPLAMNLNQGITTLGLNYDPANDAFGFNIEDNYVQQQQITKRQLLSEASKVFDPIGWLEPVTVVPKIMMQRLWLLKLNWDEAIPENIVKSWTTYRDNLPQLSKLKIRRWTGITEDNITHQLHGFSDASTQAYGAVVYLRTCNNEDDSTISLIAARSRVAPIKTVSIPRLELTAATLLADLMHHLCETVFSKINLELYAWCDSQITLHWLKSPPSRWKVFICNRTSRILTKLPDCRFGYIKSADNPADLISRGVSPEKLKYCDKWWQGPVWLAKPSHLWPATVPELTVDHNDSEAKKIVNVTTVKNEWELLVRFSSFTKLIRITAYIQRFYNKLNNKQFQSSLLITSSEINNASTTIIKHVQRTHFKEAIESITKSPNRCITRSLWSLNPFIDQQGILRVGGRLRRANITYDQQHPIILPSQSHLSQLIVNHIHHQTLHGNIQLMLTTIRLRYWIIKARSIVKRSIRNCTICQRMRAATRTPMMADLPASRVNESLPFTHTAIDYAGPIQTKATNGRGRKQIIKGYICVFICLATKAIHLEAVTSLTSEAFIAAFRRFTSRRGLCSHVYSDCGTNFKGAYRIINEYNKIYRDASPTFINDRINWHFSPPGAPHFNGLAEAGVKAVKKHLNRVIRNEILTYEEMATTLCQIEACLNSRPLCAIKDDPTQEILTPGHFLIGRTPLQLPEPSQLQQLTIINRWHIIQKLVRDFWCQWHKEYLNELQQRHKWQTNHQQLQPSVDDIVIIKDENASPLNWALGRITQLHPGDDNICRVVTIQTKNGIMRRPVVKLCWLPNQEQQS